MRSKIFTKFTKKRISLIVLVAVLAITGLFFGWSYFRAEVYCYRNLKTVDPAKEDFISRPSIDKPVLRILDRKTDNCFRACVNLRKELFDIEFECVATENIEDRELAATYTYLLSGPQERGIFTPASGEKTVSNVSLSGTVAAISSGEKEQTKTEPPILLKDNPLTLFFIEGYSLVYNGIPSKEDICEITEHESCY